MSELTRWGGQHTNVGFRQASFLTTRVERSFPHFLRLAVKLVTVSRELLVASNINAKWVTHLLLATNNRDLFLVTESCSAAFNEIVPSVFLLPASHVFYLLSATLVSSSCITWNIKFFFNLYGGWDLFSTVIYLFSMSYIYKILTLVAALYQSSAHRSVFLLNEVLK